LWRLLTHLPRLVLQILLICLLLHGLCNRLTNHTTAAVLNASRVQLLLHCVLLLCLRWLSWLSCFLRGL